MKTVDPILYVHAAVLLLTMLRVLFYKKTGRFRPGISLLAYFMILATGWTLFRVALGEYTQIDPGEFLVNLFFCVAIWLSRGNVAEIMTRRVSVRGKVVPGSTEDRLRKALVENKGKYTIDKNGYISIDLNNDKVKEAIRQFIGETSGIAERK